MLHYVAVNARTKETMGSVPIHMPKLIGISALVEVLGIILMLFIDFDYNWLFLFSGIVYYFIMYSKYRNKEARHKHELETNKKMFNLRKVDKYVTQRKGLRSAWIEGANNTSVSGQSQNFGDKMLKQFVSQNSIAGMANDNNKKGGK